MSDLKFKDFEKERARNLKFSRIPLDDLPLAMSYTPMQCFDESYNPNEALLRGTLFPELDKPFCGKFTGERRP